MISALARRRHLARPEGPVSRQKRDALFELSCRLAQVAEEAREGGSRALLVAAKLERKKALRYGLELLAEGADAERLDRDFALEALGKDLDAGTRLELAVIRAGLEALARADHPFTLLRVTSAHLGPEYFEKAGAWMLARVSKRRKAKPHDLIVPGELPDLVRGLALDPASLERALRAAGRTLAAAALAGCPTESLELCKPFFGKIGGAVLEDDAAYLRARLSGDEIAEAQAAFVEIVSRLDRSGQLELGEEEEFYNDPEFVKELTRALLSLDDRTVRKVFAGAEKRPLALAMQGMEPRAHDRILGLLPKRETRKLLDAIDDAAIMPRREVLEAGKALARAALAALAQGGAAEEARERLTRIADWPGGAA